MSCQRGGGRSSMVQVKCEAQKSYLQDPTWDVFLWITCTVAKHCWLLCPRRMREVINWPHFCPDLPPQISSQQQGLCSVEHQDTSWQFPVCNHTPTVNDLANKRKLSNKCLVSNKPSFRMFNFYFSNKCLLSNRCPFPK